MSTNSSLVVQMTTDQLKSLFIDALRDALGGKNMDIAASSSAAPTKGKRAKKSKDPNAPKKPANDWIKFTSRVRSVIATQMTDGKKPVPKAVTQVSASLKDASLMPSATDAQIIAAYQNWLANPPAVGKMEAAGKTKKSKSSKDGSSDGSSVASKTATTVTTSNAAPTTTDAPADGKKKRKPMSDDAKKAAAAKRAATKAAKSGKTAPVADTSSSTNVVATEASSDNMDFEPFNWKKMNLLKNARGDVLTEDMEWFGHYDSATGKVDTSATQPADLDL